MDQMKNILHDRYQIDFEEEVGRKFFGFLFGITNKLILYDCLNKSDKF
jgi:hypothetical protein